MTQPVPRAVRPDPPQLFAPLLLLLLLGCGHAEPFGTPQTGSDRPFDPNPPVRLTFNPGPDRGAAWLPDGSGILYSAQQPGRPDHDVCLAHIPPGGGSQRGLICDLSPGGGDSTDTIEAPAPTAEGRLAFVAVTSRRDAITPDAGAIALGAVADPAHAARIQPLPYTIPGERLHSGVSQIRWLTADRLVFLAERIDYRLRCAVCVEWDTLTTGVDVAWLDLTQAGSLPRRVAGTDYASGVSAGGTEDEIFYTLNGDPRVYRQTLSTGAISVVHDFGSAGAARDVHVVGSQMAVIVGGRIAVGVDPAFGPTAWDSGGVLHLVDLQGGGDIVLDPTGLYRRPQISPAGSAVVAEGYPLVITDVAQSGVPDTTVSRRGDLYLFGQP